MTSSCLSFCILALGFALPAPAQHEEQVTLRFLSFPKCSNPQPLELLTGEGTAIQVKIPTNAISQVYQVNRLASWSVGSLESAKTDEGKASFLSYGSAPSLDSSNQLILLFRNGNENKDGMRVLPLDYNTDNFGGGKFFFMNVSKVDINGILGGQEFALKPGDHTIIEPKETIQRSDTLLTEFFFRKETEVRPSFSSTWPVNKRARSLIFFYHDDQNKLLRMHTIRDYLP